MTVKLIYIGWGAALYNVPARDLTDDDFSERAQVWKESKIDETALIASGLYKKPQIEQPKKDKAAKEGK